MLSNIVLSPMGFGFSKSSHVVVTNRIRSSINLTTTITLTSRTKSSTSVRFRRMDVIPDPILNITPSPRSSHGLSALSCGKRLVLYGGEETAMTPIADTRHQALWLAERTSTKSVYHDHRPYGNIHLIIPPRMIDGSGNPSLIHHQHPPRKIYQQQQYLHQGLDTLRYQWGI